MTCIAWDGATLAADRQASVGSLRVATTKIIRLASGGLCGGSGDGPILRALLQWAVDGMSQDKYPENKDTDADMIYIAPDKTCWLYTRNCFPLAVEQPFMATGSGRDFAMAAMYLGKTASEAVTVAAALDTGVGHDIDTLTL